MFHWSFLAAPYPIPETLIGADYRGFLSLLMGRWVSQKHGHKVFEQLETYIDAYKNEGVIRGACEDYRAGATVDVEHEKADLVIVSQMLGLPMQKEGKYVEVPTLLLYSAANLGTRYNMKEIWEKFVNNKVTAHGVGDGAGHFVNEEKPEECAQVLLEWLKKII